MLGTRTGRAALVLLALLPLASCPNNGGSGFVGGSGSTTPPTGTVRILIGDAATDELVSFSAQIVAVHLVADDGTTTANVLSAPLRVEFLGLDEVDLWMAESDVQTDTYVGVEIAFQPGAYVARATDGSFVTVDALSDLLTVPLLAPDDLLEDELKSIVVDLDLLRSLDGDVSTGTITFDPAGSAEVAAAGELLRVEELTATVLLRDTGTLELVVQAFADDEQTVPVASVSVVVDPLTLLVETNGNPLGPAALFYTTLNPNLTIIAVHGQLQADGPFFADRIETEDQNGVPGNRFPVKLDGTIVGILPGVIKLRIQEVERGLVFAGPILQGLGNPPAVDVSLSTQELRVFINNNFILPGQLLVGDRVKIKFIAFPAPPFPAARVDVRGLDPGFRGVISDVDQVPDRYFMTVPADSLPILAGLVASESMPVAVEPLSVPVLLGTLGDPLLPADELVVGLDVLVNGIFSGGPSLPVLQQSRTRVRPGLLDDAEITGIDPSTSSFTTVGGEMRGSFGDAVSPGPFEVFIEPGAVLYGDATTEAELYDLFVALLAGERLLVDIDGIGTGAPDEIRAFTIRSRVSK